MNKKDPDQLKKPAGGVSRRGFLGGVGAGGGVLGTGVLEGQAQAQGGTKPVGPGAVPITLNINGKPQNLTVEPRVTLLEALRPLTDVLGQLGALVGCQDAEGFRSGVERLELHGAQQQLVGIEGANRIRRRASRSSPRRRTRSEERTRVPQLG